MSKYKQIDKNALNVLKKERPSDDIIGFINIIELLRDYKGQIVGDLAALGNKLRTNSFKTLIGTYKKELEEVLNSPVERANITGFTKKNYTFKEHLNNFLKDEFFRKLYNEYTINDLNERLKDAAKHILFEDLQKHIALDAFKKYLKYILYDNTLRNKKLSDFLLGNKPYNIWKSIWYTFYGDKNRLRNDDTEESVNTILKYMPVRDKIQFNNESKYIYSLLIDIIFNNPEPTRLKQVAPISSKKTIPKTEKNYTIVFQNKNGISRKLISTVRTIGGIRTYKNKLLGISSKKQKISILKRKRH